MKKSITTAALVLSALAFATTAQANEMEYVGTVRLTSSATTPITLRVNNNYQGVTVDWGDGNPVLYNDRTGTEREITGTPKGTVIISGYFGWDMFDCSGCSVTALDITEAKTLRSVFCQDNQLTELDLRGMTNLVDLDCGNNRIKTLHITDATNMAVDMPNLEMLNVANNDLTGTFTARTATLQYGSIYNNGYTVAFVTGNPNLTTFYCDGNQIKGLSLKNNSQLTAVVTYNNPIQKLVLTDNLPGLRQLLIGGNKLLNGSELDLSVATLLQDIDVEDCGLTSILTPRNVKCNTLNLARNNLSIGVLPLESYKPLQLKFEPQHMIDISDATGIIDESGVPRVNVTDWANRTKNQLDLSAYRFIGRTATSNGKADGTYTWYSVDDKAERQEMTAGTNATNPGDYYGTSGKFTFFAPQRKAICRVTSKTYDVSVELGPIVIGTDVTSINSAETDGGLNVTAMDGQLVLSAGTPQPVVIYNVAGQRVWNGTVTSDGQSVRLPRGIYIVGGKKVLNR